MFDSLPESKPDKSKRKPVFVRGSVYEDVAHASFVLGIKKMTLYQALKRGTTGYRYAHEGEQPTKWDSRPPRKETVVKSVGIVFEGARYNSVADAARSVGIPYNTVLRRMNRLRRR